MIRSVRICSAIAVIAGLVSPGVAPLMAAERVDSRRPVVAPYSPKWFDVHGEFDAHAKFDEPSGPSKPTGASSIAKLRELKGSISSPVLESHLRRLGLIEDEMEALHFGSPATRQAALERLGVTIEKIQTGDGVTTEIGVRGIRRLSFSVPHVRRAKRIPALLGSEQPDGSSPTRDELADLIAAADATATAETDAVIAELTSVADEADQVAADLENMSSAISCPEEVSGPSDSSSDCFEDILDGIGRASIVSAGARWAVNQAIAAVQNFRTFINSAAVAAMTVAEADAAIAAALVQLTAAVSSWYLIAALGVVAIGYIIYKVAQCYEPLPNQRPARLVPVSR